MFAALNEYAALINFALFGAIIGYLFQLQRSSREALNDKFEAQLEALRSRIALLEGQEKNLHTNHQAAVKLLEQQLTFYKSLADMPEDRRVLAIRSEYELKLADLETAVAQRTELQLQQRLAEVQSAAREVERQPSLTQQAAIAVLEKVVRLTLNVMGH